MSSKTDIKTIVEIYDPVMCCSTGVCGPDVDDALADFANDVKWLKGKGVEVNRFNLGQEPEVFKNNASVLSRLQKEGTECLPIILINGKVVAEGGYPDRKQLINLLDLNLDENSTGSEKNATQTDLNIMTEQIQQLIALGAALAANSESSLEFHYKRAKDLGISENDLAQTLQIAQNVKQVPAGKMIQLANELLGVGQAPSNGCAPNSGCC